LTLTLRGKAMDGFEAQQERTRPQLSHRALKSGRTDAAFQHRQQAGGAPSRSVRSVFLFTTNRVPGSVTPQNHVSIPPYSSPQAVQSTGSTSDVTFECTTRRRSSESTKKTYTTRKVAVGTVRKSMQARVPVWLARNVRQVCEGGLRRRGISRETVRSATEMPSLSNSAWIRGAPQPRFPVAIRRIRSRASFDTRGRHGPLRL
jgi:hypothetical protein